MVPDSGRATPDRAADIRCIVCSRTLASVLAPGGENRWNDHMHAWDDRAAAAEIIAEDEAARS